MSNLYQAGEFQSCLQFFHSSREQESIQPDAVVYRLAIQSAMKLHDDSALSLYEEAKQAGHEATGTKETAYYNQLMTYLGDRDQLMMQITVLNDMKRNEVPLSEYTFAPIINTCRRLEKVDRALSVWREAIKNQCASTSIFNSLLDLCHELRPEEIPNLQEQLRQAQLTPNEYTFAIQLKTAASFEEAYEIFQRLKEDQDHPPNVVCYNTLLKRCGADSRHHALEIIQEMIDRDIQPDDITFIHMIKLATTGGSFSEAWQVYELLKDRIDMTTNSMNCMINCCSHFRSLPHAEQVLRDGVHDIDLAEN